MFRQEDSEQGGASRHPVALPRRPRRFPRCSVVRTGPERTASVRVHRGGEVFVLGFGPYVGPTFEYDEEEKLDELRARLAAAVAAVRGPSRAGRLPSERPHRSCALRETTAPPVTPSA